MSSTTAEINDLLDDNLHADILKEYRLSDDVESLRRDRVLVVQPFVRGITPQYTLELMMNETLGLADTLNWNVVEKITFGRSASHQGRIFFGYGQLDILNDLAASAQVDLIFLSTYSLTPSQRALIFENVTTPVLDRYNVVLRIFERHARTPEAKLQVALAQIPYLKNRLAADWSVENDNKHSGSRFGHEHFQRRQMMLGRKERRLKDAIEDLRANRQKIRSRIGRKEIPKIAIVGYTNGGKTSLIKALASDESQLQPEDKLFATLDVTSHLGVLRNGLKVMYVDTVGFISDIPTDLIASFSATLEDAVEADLVITVGDCSHPDYDAQREVVTRTLRRLGIEKASVIDVANKMDLIKPEEWSTLDALPISATEGFGLDVLSKIVEKELMKRTLKRNVTLRCKTASEDYSWIRQNLHVVSVEGDEEDANYSQIKCIIDEQDVGRIKKHLY